VTGMRTSIAMTGWGDCACLCQRKIGVRPAVSVRPGGPGQDRSPTLRWGVGVEQIAPQSSARGAAGTWSAGFPAGLALWARCPSARSAAVNRRRAVGGMPQPCG
jgi:hypothetical protein